MDPAEQRANAVAMLRRAASLPRMKDGRRPPMHGDAGGTSEGEISQSEEKKDEPVSLEMKGEAVGPQPSTPAPKEPEQETDRVPTASAEEKDGDDATDAAQEISEPDRPTSSTQDKPSKRRSRSRSRSRGSKDMRAKMRQLELASQAQAQADSAGGASADDLRAIESPSPQLTAQQAYLMQLQMATAHSPPLMPTLAPFGYATPTMGTGLGAPAMPSLQALQTRHLQGLFRSNSAAARMMAMSKLTGEPLDFGSGPLSASPALGPSPSPSLGARRGLMRNNTVAGEERVAARQQLLRRLNEGIKERGDFDLPSTSGPEDTSPSGTQTPKSRRRRSRRKSGSALVDDRDGTNTPAALALKELSGYPPLIALPPSRAPSAPLEKQVTSTPDPQTQDASLARTPTPLVHLHQYDSPMGHRGPIVEEEDDDPVPTPPRASRSTAHTGSSASISGTSPSRDAIPRPAPGPSLPEVHRQSPLRQDMFPKSPFERPREEPPDEEHVLFGTDSSRMRAKAANDLLDREISWVADPVPMIAHENRGSEISWIADEVPEARELTSTKERDVSWIDQGSLGSRMPIYDEDEDEVNEEDAKEAPVPGVKSESISRTGSRRTSPRAVTASQELLIDLETTPDHTPPKHYSAPSQESTTSPATLNSDARQSNVSEVSRVSGGMARADTSSPVDRAHSQADSLQGWNEYAGAVIDSNAPALASKRSADSTGGGTITWSRMRNAFTRSGSSLGRRSRTNSLAREKRENTESSRESGTSVASGKRESKEWSQQAQLHGPRTPSPGVMLAAPPPPRTGVSPIPPPSDTEAAKYSNPKLFPFPGMVKLQEETLRNKSTGGIGISASSPDVTTATANADAHAIFMGSANSSMSSQHLDNVRERKLSHQASDSRLLPKYQLSPGPGTVSGAPSSGGAQIEYFNIPQPPPASSSSNTSGPLPFTREGVKKWLNMRFFPSNSQQGGHSQSSSTDSKYRSETSKKPSLSDLLGRKDMGNISDWEDADKARAANASTSTSTSTGTAVVQSSSRDASREEDIHETSYTEPVRAYVYPNTFARAHEPDTDGLVDAYDSREHHASRHISAPLSSSHEPSSATPDPASSEESLAQSSQKSSSLGSLYSPEDTAEAPPKAAEILQRLDQILHAEYHNRLWSTALNTPPRRLLLSSPMLQVANCNTVKDRFLFLFTDILIIAKPMLPDRDSLVDPQKVYPPDRKFFIKNVVHLKDVRLNIDRDEDPRKPTSALISQRPEFIRNFAREFAEDADTAISKLIDLRDPKGHITLGRLLVQLPEIDRAKLGEYLSRRTSKNVLKAYLDAFGFTGIDIDTALRIFLLSIHMPSGNGHGNTLEALLDMFAGRWYEANASIVAFDRDLALRLVRAIVRLNEALHAPMSHDGAFSNYNRPHVTARDFTEAFRRHDPRGLVPDSTLEKIYTSVRHEKLCQARNPSNTRPPVPVSLKRPIPSRITYRRQSEPIVVRIPQIDSLLTIHLYGQDLIFDPPILTFAKSTEASFRVTGTAFGSKTMVVTCAGPNAPNYSGMPLSTMIAVERAFMRNTFQLAFADAHGRKRKYMFSVDDPVIRHEWTSSLKRQIEAARTGLAPPELPGVGNAQMQVYRAAEMVSFNVLQETLVSSSTNGGSTRHTPKPERTLLPDQNQNQNLHIRSRSRSQVYRHGAGRHEYLNGNGNAATPSEDTTASESELNGGAGGVTSPPDAANSRLWTSAELELVCQQNSAIALVLSFLQAALPYDEDEDPTSSLNGNGGFFPPQFSATPIQRNQSQSSAFQI